MAIYSCDECLLPPPNRPALKRWCHLFGNQQHRGIGHVSAANTSRRGCVSNIVCCLPRQHFWASQRRSDQIDRSERACDALKFFRNASDAQKYCLSRRLALGYCQRTLWFVCLTRVIVVKEATAICAESSGDRYVYRHVSDRQRWQWTALSKLSVYMINNILIHIEASL